MKPGPTWSLSVVVAALGCASANSGGGIAGGGVVPDPAIHVRERVVHSDVEGATVEELARALDRSGPRIPEGRFRGLTRWNVSWRYRYTRRGGACAIVDADVRLEVTTTLPRWRRAADAGLELERKWRDYLAALEGHEAGHRNYAVRAANEMLTTLRDLRTASCGHIEDEANARGRWILERFRALNREYDRETRHGRTQGATWPPAERVEGGP
ncbi:MAG TPA: DUF922 domain-containing protein [Gemmatimonadota bacterium]|nr:DUF922 domain-containing protein [Gemmatimonadota bacterium]